MMRTLLGRRDVDPDMTDLTSETALSQALKRGHHAIAKLLSERKNLIPLSDGDESTMLSSPEAPDLHQPPPKGSADFDVQCQSLAHILLFEIPPNQPRPAASYPLNTLTTRSPSPCSVH